MNDAVLIDDGRSDQLVHPQFIGIVDRLGRQHHIAERFGLVAVVYANELHKPTTLMRPRRSNLERSVRSAEH